MAEFKLDFACDNEAFSPGVGYTRDEIARVLRDIARVIERADASLSLGGSVYDVNGNTIGHYAFTGEDDNG